MLDQDVAVHIIGYTVYNMKVKVTLTPKEMGLGVLDTLRYVTNKKGFRTRVNEIFAETVDPWVPYITGALSQSGLTNVDSRGVHYTVDYAEKVYTSDWPHYPVIHPLASSYWDEVAMQTQRDVFIQKVQEVLVNEIKSKRN